MTDSCVPAIFGMVTVSDTVHSTGQSPVVQIRSMMTFMASTTHSPPAFNASAEIPRSRKFKTYRFTTPHSLNSRSYFFFQHWWFIFKRYFVPFPAVNEVRIFCEQGLAIFIPSIPDIGLIIKHYTVLIFQSYALMYTFLTGNHLRVLQAPLNRWLCPRTHPP